ncbi:MAG: hypothetical protein ACK5DL_03830 [Burkholderiales bacterium]|nr:hypothetical protein [Betaproteobacteria bacterium]
MILIAFEGDLNAFELVRIVAKMYFDTVVEIDHYRSFVGDFASSNFGIHYFVELSRRPFALMPAANNFAVANKLDTGLNREMNFAKRKLYVELPDTKLRRELSNYLRQIQITRYAIHSCNPS